MLIQTVSDFTEAVAMPYAWPGMYPKYFITSDGACLSYSTAKAEADRIAEAIADRSDAGWRVVAVEINWESVLFCDHSGKQIESAYDPIEDR